MNVFTALAREIAHAEEQHRPLLHIRVTRDALCGSPASLPITPERLRGLYPESLTLGRVQNGVIPHHGMELLVHPDDWLDVQADPRIAEAGPVQLFDRFYGVRVIG